MALTLGSLEFDVLLVPRLDPDAAPIKAGTITVDLPLLQLGDDGPDTDRVER